MKKHDDHLLEQNQRNWFVALAEISSLLDFTPAESGVSDEAKGRIQTERMMGFLSDHLYRVQLAIATLEQSGGVAPDYLVAWIGSAVQLASRSMANVQGFCTASEPAECDWRGPLEECGPRGVCPKCKALGVIRLDRKPKLVVPGANGVPEG